MVAAPLLLLRLGSSRRARLSGAANPLALTGLGTLEVCGLWVGACHGAVE